MLFFLFIFVIIMLQCMLLRCWWRFSRSSIYGQMMKTSSTYLSQQVGLSGDHMGTQLTSCSDPCIQNMRMLCGVLWIWQCLLKWYECYWIFCLACTMLLVTLFGDCNVCKVYSYTEAVMFILLVLWVCHKAHKRSWRYQWMHGMEKDHLHILFLEPASV